MARKPKPTTTPADGKNEHDLLAAHAHRKIRAFLIEPDRGNHSNTRVFDAFWAVVYGYTVVDHATAVAVERELMASTRTVQEVLEGWRPEALQQPEEQACTAKLTV